MDRGIYTGETLKQVSSSGEEIHVRHGHGSYVYPGGSCTYSGEWIQGVKHGHGVFSVGRSNPQQGDYSHSVYEGQFQQGEMTGRGLKRWADGSSYSGPFLQGEPHGEGVFLKHGAKFEGEYVHGVRDGQGALTSANGTEYIGEWQSGKMHGEGACRWQDGAGYDGTFAFGRPDGNGVEQLPDGSNYEGAFRDGLRSGQGYFQHAPSGMRVEGEFERGRPALVPTHIKLRVAKPLDDPAAAVASDAASTGRSSSREKGSSKDGGTSPSGKGPAKLSKKKQEEARKAAEELASYRSTLTDGVVTLDDGAQLPVIDEGMQLTADPGHKLPLFYLCACSRAGAVAASEHGRVFRVTLALHPVPLASEVEATTARSRANFEAIDPEEDQPIVAFCTCPGAKTVPWTPPTPAEPESEEKKAAAAASSKKKKPAAAATKTPSAGAKHRKASVTSFDGPPPPFICDGSCIQGLERSAHTTQLTRDLRRGFAIFDDVWLSGACTAGVHLDITIEDITPGLATAASSSPISSPRRTAATSDDIGPPPTGLYFAPLATYQLRLLTSGTPPKRSKKGAKKPAPAANGEKKPVPAAAAQ